MYLHTSTQGRVKIDDRIYPFVNNEEFQRLGYIKQLGPSSSTFICGTHTRLEHSICVYDLSQKVMEVLGETYYCVSEHHTYLLGIAALWHDIGHVAFSHSIDTMFEVRHEARGIQLMYTLAPKMDPSLTVQDLDVIAAIIEPKRRNTVPTEYWYLTDLVSSQVDVDRMAYILMDTRNTGSGSLFTADDASCIMKGMRIVDDRIAFVPEVKVNIQRLLVTRYHMTRNVYFHPRALAYDAMIRDAFTHVKPHVFEEWLHLLDNIVTPGGYSNFDDEGVAILKRMHRGDLYKVTLCFSDVIRSGARLIGTAPSSLKYVRMTEGDFDLSVDHVYVVGYEIDRESHYGCQQD